MTFESKYTFGDLVVLKTDREERPRMVTQITFNPGSIPRYNLSCEAMDSWHYEMELDPLQTKNKTAGFRHA